MSPTTRTIASTVSSTVLALLLSACGGGGGGDAPAVSPDNGTSTSSGSGTSDTAGTNTPSGTGTASGSAAPPAGPATGGQAGNTPSNGTSTPAVADRSAALAARFNAPRGIAADAVGNLYVADGGNATVRKIAPNGAVTTLAGAAGQFAAPFGDIRNGDGPGSAARFNVLTGIAADNAGNLYVADTFTDKGRIRMIGADGNVVSLLGDVYALGLAVDTARNVYIAANGRGMNRGVLRLEPSGALTGLDSLAGRAIARDAAGDLYIADTGLDYGPLGQTSFSCAIVRVTAGGASEVIAGKRAGEFENTCGYADGTGAAAKFAGSEALAVNASGTLYVADTGNHIIRKVSGDGIVTTLAGMPGSPGSADGTGAAARFNEPKGIAIDDKGDLYVSDTGNHTIRKVTAAGAVSTIAGAAGQAGSADALAPSATPPPSAGE